jgi:hypothetical protein
MTIADWQNAETNAVTYAVDTAAGRLGLRIDRSLKTIAWETEGR